MSSLSGSPAAFASHRSDAGLGSRMRPGIVIGALACLFVLFLVGYPLLIILAGTFFSDGRPSFAAIGETLAEPGLVALFLDTALVIGASATIAVVMGGLLAWVNERTDAGLGAFSSRIPLISLVVPLIAGAIGWTFLLSSRVGFINVAIRTGAALLGIHFTEGPFDIFSWPGLVLAYGAALTPFAYLPMAAAFAALDDSLEEASRVCGASGRRTLLRVTIPAIAPSILGAIGIVIVVALAQYAVPVVVATGANIPILSVRIVQLLTATFPPRTGIAIVLSLFLALSVSAITALQLLLTRHGNFSSIGGRALSRRPLALGVWRWPVRLAMIAFLGMVSVVPAACIALVSLQPFFTPHLGHFTLANYRQIFAPGSTGIAVLLRTLKLAVISGAAGVVLSFAIALAARQSSPRLGRLFTAVPVLPAMLSQPVLATGFILAFAGAPFHLAGNAAILVLAYVTVFLPQAYYGVAAAAGQVGSDLLEASAASGAGAARTFLKVMLPLSMAGVFNAWAIVVALVITDVTIPALLAGSNNAVIGYEILNLYQGGTFPNVAAYSVLSMALAGFLLFGLSALVRRWFRR